MASFLSIGRVYTSIGRVYLAIWRFTPLSVYRLSFPSYMASYTLLYGEFIPLYGEKKIPVRKKCWREKNADEKKKMPARF